MLSKLLVDTNSIVMLAIVAVLVVVIIVFYVMSSKKRKKQEQDAQDLINAVKPGNKVKTIGGICGIVVEVDNEENTFVLETGTEVSGKSYIKFDRQAIYQTDAVVEKKEETKPVEKTEKTEEAPAEAPKEESAPEENSAAPVEETAKEEEAVALSPAPAAPEMVKTPKKKAKKPAAKPEEKPAEEAHTEDKPAE